MPTFDIPPDSITNVEEWLRVRLGKCTASRIADATRQLKKGGWGQDRENYKMELIAERLTGQAKQRFISESMIWGQQVERDAMMAYQSRTDCQVNTDTWFIAHPTIEWSGCSPDALVDGDGLLQIKCPETSTFVKALIKKEVEPDYYAQVQWELACSGRKWGDLVLFDPRITDPKLRMLRWHIERDDAWIGTTEAMVRVFLKEIADAIEQLGAEVSAPKIEAPKEPEPVMGWSDNLPAEDFSSIESLMAKGLIRKGV